MSKPRRKIKGPQVLTGNRLIDGDVVYWRDENNWVLDLSEAHVFEDVEALTAAEEIAIRQVGEGKVVDPYPFGVETEGAAIIPASMREAIRAKGPTIRLDLGKQAEGV